MDSYTKHELTKIVRTLRTAAHEAHMAGRITDDTAAVNRALIDLQDLFCEELGLYRYECDCGCTMYRARPETEPLRCHCGEVLDVPEGWVICQNHGICGEAFKLDDVTIEDGYVDCPHCNEEMCLDSSGYSPEGEAAAERRQMGLVG